MCVLGLGINHLDGDGLFTGNTGSDFRSEDTGTVVNGTLPNQQAFGLFGNLSIKEWHNVVHAFNEGNFTAQSGVDVGELETNVSTSDNGDPFWYVGEFESTIRSANSLFIDSDTRRDKGNTSGGQDDILQVGEEWASVRNKTTMKR